MLSSGVVAGVVSTFVIKRGAFASQLSVRCTLYPTQELPRLVLYPTLSDPTLAEDYSPLWDLRIGFYSPAAIQKHLNKTARTDANEILNLAAEGLITSQGGRPLRSAGIIINCPAIGFLNEKPLREPVPNRPQPADVSSVE